MLIDLEVELLPDLLGALLGAHLAIIKLELDGTQRTVMQKDDSDGPLVGAFLATSLSRSSPIHRGSLIDRGSVGGRNCKARLVPAQLVPAQLVLSHQRILVPGQPVAPRFIVGVAPTAEGADGGKGQPNLNFQNASGHEIQRSR